MARMNDTYEVLGWRRIDYTKKQTGEHVQGYEVYLTPTQPPEDVVGLCTDKVWLSDKYSCYCPEVGNVVRKVYNKWGSVEDLLSCG